MLSLKRSLIIIGSLLYLLALAACSGTPASSNATTYTNPAKATSPRVTNVHKSVVTPTGTQIQATHQSPPDTMATVPATNGQNTGSTTDGGNGGQNTTTTPPDNGPGPDQHPPAPTPTPSQGTGTTGTTGTSGGTSQGGGNQNTSGPTYIRVVPISINGQSVQILTTGTGMTLYYRTSDVTPNTICTAACAQTWPSFLAQGQLITSVPITSGQLTIQNTANGSQVAYNGHPLYTYAGDKAQGQANGQGLGNVWLTISVKVQAQHW